MKIGDITLQLSFGLYICMLIPQLRLNLQRRSVEGLSWGMHLMMLVGMLCDIFYALAQKMPWQYLAVSFSVLGSLLLQHGQFFAYRLADESGARRAPPGYLPLSLGLLGLCVLAISQLGRASQLSAVFFGLGYAAQGLLLLSAAPQIITNAQLRSTAGVAAWFVGLQALGLVADTITSFSLNFGLPNKLGAPAALLQQLILLAQFARYRRPPTPAAPYSPA